MATTTRDNRNTTDQDKNNSKKGFGSMPPEKVQEIAQKGGEASARKAGPEGMAERGQQGGYNRASSRDPERQPGEDRQGAQSDSQNSSVNRKRENEEDEDTE